jgi:NitT/TauT family transport system substrate-binding protein
MLGEARRFRWPSWLTLGVALVALVVCAPAQPAAPAAKAPEPAAWSGGAPTAAAQSGGASAVTAPAQSAAQAPVPITEVVLGLPGTSLAFLPAWVSQESGINARHGLSVKVIAAPAPTVTAALVSGEMQFTAAVGSAIRAAAQGIPLKVVSYIVRQPLTTFYVREDIRRPEELRGKTVAITGHTDTTGIFGKQAVERLGLDQGDMHWLTTGGLIANNLAAISSGQAQATVLTPPWGAMALQQGYRKLIGVEQVMPNQPFTGIAAFESLIQEKPEVVKRMIRATLETLVWMRDNKDATLPVMMKEFDIDQAVAAAVYDELIESYTWDGRAPDEGVRAVIAQTLADVSDQQVSVAQVQDLRLLEEVLAEGPRR